MGRRSKVRRVMATKVETCDWGRRGDYAESTSGKQARWQMITPEVAQRYLDRTIDGQRRVLRERVNDYAADMAAGRYDLIGDTIKLDDTGALMDGQHRLHAIIKSGLAMEMLIVRNIDPAALVNIDTGLKRSPKNTFEAAGYGPSNGYSTRLPSAVATLYAYANRQWRKRMVTRKPLDYLTGSVPGLAELDKSRVIDRISNSDVVQYQHILVLAYLVQVYDAGSVSDVVDWALAIARNDALKRRTVSHRTYQLLVDIRNKPMPRDSKRIDRSLMVMGVMIAAWNTERNLYPSLPTFEDVKEWQKDKGLLRLLDDAGKPIDAERIAAYEVSRG